MSLTWGQIQTWSSAGLSTYAGTVGARRDTVVKQAEALQARMSSFKGEGATADALRAKMGVAHKELTTLADDLLEIQEAVKVASGDVSQVESAVKLALQQASSTHCTISAAGIATCSSAGNSMSEYTRQSIEFSVNRLVGQAVDLANTADTTLNARLKTVGTPGSTAKSTSTQTHDLSDAEQKKFKNMTPEERARYWSQQSEAQKQHLCDTYPDLIGNADGVEGWARDRANRNRLPKLKQEAEENVSTYTELLKNPWIDDSTRAYYLSELDKAEKAVKAYDIVQKQVKKGISLEDYQHGKEGDPVSLLTLQNDGGRVKAAMGKGDVDHAKNVATFVPGIGTTVEGSMVEYMRQTKNLRRAAMAQGNLALSDVATVAWLGYDAPGEFDLKKHPEDVPGIISPFLAQAGSDRLVGFMNGMQASREYGAGDAHMTLVGHSYGSSTSGMAATKVKYGVIDDLVLFGSPGMGTYDVKNYHVDQNHLWVSGVPKGDSVQGAGAFRGGIVGSLGKNPMDSDSGFSHLSDDATGSPKYNKDAPASKLSNFNFDNHSIYLEDGTETLQDIGRVVAGVKR
ncbi:alpha/beta hydrolase [Actinomyces sp. oral taxon 181]|uniref:alpha/beta hydrolase n=1 Tax=Actinomyces sp. oral taxon 181 TaxID=712121 RepID=UPI0025C59231|nr:alpha/beta hydrolase [Actinomyces sp. oral taxon 181]MBS5750491.1 hypothetical protein [Actinomyces sp. oral taxon 181]